MSTRWSNIMKQLLPFKIWNSPLREYDLSDPSVQLMATARSVRALIAIWMYLTRLDCLVQQHHMLPTVFLPWRSSIVIFYVLCKFRVVLVRPGPSSKFLERHDWKDEINMFCHKNQADGGRGVSLFSFSQYLPYTYYMKTCKFQGLIPLFLSVTKGRVTKTCPPGTFAK